MFSKRQEDRISKLLVYCANKTHGCKSTLEVSEYQHHLSVDNPQGCFFTKLPFPIGCAADVFRGVLGHTDMCPRYPLACPQACGAEVLHKDLTTHQGVCSLEPVACPFSDIGCKVKVPRRDRDKHIQFSMLQHMTDMALSHTTLKEEHETLKKYHTALKKDHTALKEDHTTLKENNGAKMNATGLFLKNHNSDEAASTITRAQLYTLLVDTSTMERGSTLSLALSESNIKSATITSYYKDISSC